ncbi:transposable element Tcb2 transposase [Trichonephila clavipes]|nr:transposable element Tcb2 transposase [Trichonephila clavipes]
MPPTNQTSRREDRHIIRNARVGPTASSAAIQSHTQVAPSLGAPVSFRTIRRLLTEGHLGSRCKLRVLPLTPTHQHLLLEWTRDQVVFSYESRFNPSSDDNRVCVLETI